MKERMYYTGEFFLEGPPSRGARGDANRVVNAMIATAEWEQFIATGFVQPCDQFGVPTVIKSRVRRWLWRLGEWLQDKAL